MSVKACQIVSANITGCAGRDIPVCRDYTHEVKICREAPSEKLAEITLRNVISGNCRGGDAGLGYRETINSCTPMGKVWTEVVKPNSIQKIGIVISDFLDGIFN